MHDGTADAGHHARQDDGGLLHDDLHRQTRLPAGCRWVVSRGAVWSGSWRRSVYSMMHIVVDPYLSILFSRICGGLRLMTGHMLRGWERL